MVTELVVIQKSDLEQIIKWRMMPEITRYMYTDPILTLEIQEQWFSSLIGNDKVKYWMIQIDRTKIGVLNLSGIDYLNKRASWAYYIGDTSFRGKGIATILECNIYDYVFNVLNLNKLCCEVFTFNEKVISIHQKFGSVIEGTFKQHIYKNGKLYDIVSMAITKDKWNRIKNNFEYDKIVIQE